MSDNEEMINEEMEQDNGQTLAIVDLCLFIVSNIGLFSDVFTDIPVIGKVLEGAGLFAFIIMIVLRVKYPQNRLGKVLMILMIVELVLAVIAAILFVLSCIACMNMCAGMG